MQSSDNVNERVGELFVFPPNMILEFLCNYRPHRSTSTAASRTCRGVRPQKHVRKHVAHNGRPVYLFMLMQKDENMKDLFLCIYGVVTSLLSNICISVQTSLLVKPGTTKSPWATIFAFHKWQCSYFRLQPSAIKSNYVMHCTIFASSDLALLLQRRCLSCNKVK